MIVGIDGLRRRFKNGIWPARVWIDRQEQCVSCEPPKIDHAIDDRLGRIGNILIASSGVVDQVGQLWNLLHRRENYIDRLVDLILDRLERDDADLSDPRANLSGHMDAAAAFQSHLERSAGGAYFS